MRILVVAISLATAAAALAGSATTKLPPGAVFEVSRDIESSSQTSDGVSTGSSTDRDTIEERVIAIGPAGVELEYDLARGTTAEDRARQWQFPARVMKPAVGPLQLINAAELSQRAAAWLKAAGLTEAACGHWYFTWTAFQIECDPQSVIETLNEFDLGPDGLADGVPYTEADALVPASIKRTEVSATGSVFHAQLAINPDAVRRDLAKSDFVAGEIMRKPVTMEEALRARSTQQITGTIDITFRTDAGGHVVKQTKVTTLNGLLGFGGQPETKTSTETLELRVVTG